MRGRGNKVRVGKCRGKEHAHVARYTEEQMIKGSGEGRIASVLV